MQMWEILRCNELIPEPHFRFFSDINYLLKFTTVRSCTLYAVRTFFYILYQKILFTRLGCFNTHGDWCEGHARSYTKFGPNRFSRFYVYWIHPNRHTNKQNIYILEVQGAKRPILRLLGRFAPILHFICKHGGLLVKKTN